MRERVQEWERATNNVPKLLEEVPGIVHSNDRGGCSGHNDDWSSGSVICKVEHNAFITVFNSMSHKITFLSRQIIRTVIRCYNER